MVLTEAVSGKSSIPWQMKHLIYDIRMMLNQLDQVQVNHIYREANMAADWLSKYGHSLTGNAVAIDFCNIAFRSVVLDDMLGRTLVRRHT